ncbi:hypothetical protein JOD45_000948 [Scopulibacillus daqui]|uniref:Uncharacterized protein n=1 Tax=Scopulibacillus daqui TaxID=1469162 RepID=A0ABS2PXS3_9BACL|nr:hypothetical protein [Scopulibacillus daqui]
MCYKYDASLLSALKGKTEEIGVKKCLNLMKKKGS